MSHDYFLSKSYFLWIWLILWTFCKAHLMLSSVMEKLRITDKTTSETEVRYVCTALDWKKIICHVKPPKLMPQSSISFHGSSAHKSWNECVKWTELSSLVMSISMNLSVNAIMVLKKLSTYHVIITCLFW